ncbi:hypothetical protein BH11PSE4_BH11PSE4_00040 [soil metagenome]
MSDPNAPISPPPDGYRPPRSGWLTALMIIVGIILLLPGLCALVVGALSIHDPMASTFLPLIFICLLIGFGGIVLLRAAFRGRQR